MPEGYKIYNQSSCYFLTFSIVHWVDVFSRKKYRDIMVDAFNYAVENKSLEVYAWVIMSNHLHCILSSGNETLSKTIGELKTHTSKAILHSIQTEAESRREWMLPIFSKAAQQHERNTNFQFWTHHNHPVVLDPQTPGMFDSRLRYIHQNPVRAGLVSEARDYMYSSARDYFGENGLIKLKIHE